MRKNNVLKKIRMAVKEPSEIFPYLYFKGKRNLYHLKSYYTKEGKTTGKKSIKVKMGRRCIFNIDPGVLEAFDFFTLLNYEGVKEMRSFIALAKNKKCFMDIGSLYGIFSLVFTTINSNGIAYALEPSPEPFKILNMHREMNPLLKIQPFKVAIGDHDGEIVMKFQDAEEHLVAVNSSSPEVDSIKIEAVKLDTFTATYNIVPDIIKIDTEGYEFHVLRGGEQFLKTHKPVLCLEVHTVLLKKLGVSLEELVELIYSLGYKVYDLNHRIIKDLGLFSKNRDVFRVVCSKTGL